MWLAKPSTAITEMVQGAFAVEQVKRKLPPVSLPTGKPSPVAYCAQIDGAALPRDTSTFATP